MPSQKRTAPAATKSTDRKLARKRSQTRSRKPKETPESRAAQRLLTEQLQLATEQLALFRRREDARLRKQAKRSANLPQKPMEQAGIRSWPRSPFVNPSAEQQRVLGSRDALYGRAFGKTGPGPLYFNRNFEITIERIARVHSEVEQIGWTWNKADLDQRLLREEAHLRQADRSIRVRILNAPLRFKPAGHGRLAALVCNAVEATFDQLDGFKRSAAEILVAMGTGYGLQEVVYRPRTIRIPVAKDLSLGVPTETIHRLDMIPGRSVLFDVVTDRPWVMQGEAPGHEVDPFEDPETGAATHKAVLLTDIALTGEPIRMRGYQFAAHLLGYLKGLAWERGGITLENYGVATPYAEFDATVMNPTDEQWERARRAAEDVGKGAPAVMHGFKIGTTPIPPSLAAIHQQFIGMINAEFSKLVTSQTLAMETGGVGSYNASDTHADQQELVQQYWAQLLADAYRSQLVRYLLDLNAEAWARAFAPYCPGELCTPDAIRACAPYLYWQIRRRETRTDRLKQFIDSKNAGWAPDEQQVYDEMDFRRPSGPDAGSATGSAAPPPSPAAAPSDSNPAAPNASPTPTLPAEAAAPALPQPG